MKPKFRSLITAFAPLQRSSLIVCASLCAAASVHAQSGTWTSLVSGGNWSDIANWNNGAGPVANGAGNTANFSTVDLPAGLFTVNLDSSRTIGNINFGDSDAITTAGTWEVAGATTLTLDAATPTITTGVSTTIAPVIAGTAGLVKAGAGSLTLASANTFTGALNVTAGNLTLSNTNAYAGGTTIAPGSILTLGLGTSFSSGGIGTGTVELRGTLNSTMSTGNTLTYPNAINVGSGQTGTINTPNRFEMSGAVTGSGTLNMNIVTNTTRADFRNSFTDFFGNLNFTGSGTMRFRINQSAPAFNGGSFANTTMDLGGSVGTQVVSNSGGNTLPIGALSGSSDTAFLGGGTVGAATYSIGGLGTDTVFAGGISGNSILTKVGAGTLTLTNTTILDYTGATNINEGSLKINGVKSGAGPTTVNGDSSGRLTGTGSIAGTTTVVADGHLAPGDNLVADGIGTITHTNLTLAAGSYVDLEFGTGNDSVTIASGGTLTLSPGVKINAFAGLEIDAVSFGTNGTYPIFNVTGATVNGFNSSTFVVENGVPGKVYSFTQSAGAISMIVSDTDPNNFWNVDGAGTWNLAANWTKNLVPNAPGALAKIGPGQGGVGLNFSSDPNITLDGNRTVGELTFNDDFGAVISINPGLTTPGTLVMDNGAVPAGLVTVKGNHFINSPVLIDPQGVAIDVPASYTFTMTGVISGASVTKTGEGTLALTGDNTYTGGTTLAGGLTRINTATSLGAIGSPATFNGGTLQLANDLAGITRGYQVSGVHSAIIDTNGFNLGYAGSISPTGGGTGGLTKTGLGIMTLTGAHTYTGTTAVNTEVLALAPGSSISGGATIVTGGSLLSVAGGSLTSSATSTVTGAGIELSSGSLAFSAGLNVNTNNPNSNYLINLTGGTFSSSFLAMGRSATFTIDAPPTAGFTTVGLYINGATATIAGNLSLGTSNNTNSTVSARIDSGSLTVGGGTFIQVNSPNRWSLLDLNGGIFTSTDTVTGIQIGSGMTGNNAFLVRNGSATVERILLTQPAASTLTSLLSVSGGELYVGAGGIVGNNNAGTGILDIQLGDATLGAKADWSTLLGATLNGTAQIKASDALNAPHDISIAGNLVGAGGINKTGAGTLSLGGANTYAGTTTITEGKLEILGDSSGALGDVSVASGATLGGNGNIGGNVTIAAGGRQEYAVAATSATQTPRIITGTLTLGSGTFLDLTVSGPVASGTYTLATATTIVGAGNVPIKGNVNGLNATVSVSGNSLMITIVASDFDTWISGFTFAPGADLTTTGDPDGDGMNNLQEYAFGLIPNSGSSVNPITVQLNKTTGLFTYTRRRPSLTGMTYVYLYSTTLASWTPFTPDSAVSNNGNPVESITVDVPNALLANDSLFVRVQAVR